MARAEESNDEERSISPKVVSPAAFGMALMVTVNFVNGLTFSKNPYLVLGYILVLIIFASTHFISRLRFGRAHFFYLYSYHWLLAFMLIFIVPTLSYYLYLWVMLMYMAEYFYQLKGFILSAVSLFAVMILGTLYQYGGLTPTLVRQIIPEVIIIITVNLVMSRLAFGNRQHRKDMANKIVHAEYEHGRLVALINSMSDAVIATDEDGKILTYNAAALDLLNTNMTLSDMPVNDVMKLIDTKGSPVDALDIARKTTYLQRRADLSIPISKEDKIDLDMSISRIARSTLLAKQQGYTFLLRDITEQKSLDEERDLFISEVSHELRTPITIAEGDMSMAVLLIDKPEPKIPEIKDSVEKAHDQIIFLADMVNDLSALSRAQREDKGMEVETFEVEEVVKELGTMYQPQAEKKGLYFKLDIAPSVPPLTTSRLYFREIMQNFITNAIKYTSKGGVTIKAQAIDRDNIIIGVTDTGAGIAKSEQAKVYQKFWRSEDPYTRSTSGTGLGLFITAKLAHRLGAQLDLKSAVNEGSTFSIILPAKAFKTIDQTSAVKNEVAHLFD
jgi:signal transduction histidine kinase